MILKPPETCGDTASLQDSGLSTTTCSSLDEPLENTTKEVSENIDALTMQLNEAGPVTLALAGITYLPILFKLLNYQKILTCLK